MIIKFFSSLVVFILVFAPLPSFAKKPTLSSLNYAVKVISKQNNTLQRNLNVQQQTVKKQEEILQDVLQQQAQTTQTLAQLQQQLVALQQKKPIEQDNTLLYLFSALATLTFGLSLLSLYLLHKKHQPETEILSSRINQIEADINKLSGQTAQQYHEIDSLKVTHNESLKSFSQKLDKLDYDRKQSYERRQAVEKELQMLLHYPITYEASEADQLVLNTMLEEGNLSFDETLQAKALFAEYQNQWQLAIVYWETLLAENKKNTLALLHVAYGNYKLAEQYRKDDHYLLNATDTYGEIMHSAPEYFEDINAYDDDENMGASELVNDPDKVLIYQQIEKLVMKVDELKNYYSIYNLACQYAKEGDTEAAQDWLEQLSIDSHVQHCKHLQQEQDLDSLRDFPWFQDLLEASCEKVE